MTQYLTLEDALSVVSKFGFHIRDAGLLSSALARPASTLMGVDAYASLTEKAAVLVTGAAAGEITYEESAVYIADHLELRNPRS